METNSNGELSIKTGTAETVRMASTDFSLENEHFLELKKQHFQFKLSVKLLEFR